LPNSPLKIRGARGVMKNTMDAEQSSNRVLEITPFIPLILRGRENETIPVLRVPFLR
jgi:hypothetical protein